MCSNYSICWLPIIKGGKLVWYKVVVTNFCSNFCCKTTRSRENTHYLLTYVVGCGVVSQHLGQSFGPSTSLAPPLTIRLNDGNGPMIVHNVTESGQVCNSTEVPEGPRGRRQPRRMAGKSQQPPASDGGLVFFKKFRRRDKIHK